MHEEEGLWREAVQRGSRAVEGDRAVRKGGFGGRQDSVEVGLWRGTVW